MKASFTEKTMVGVLFVVVLIFFSMAQNETNRIEQLYNGGKSSLKAFPAVKPEARIRVEGHMPRTVKSS